MEGLNNYELEGLLKDLFFMPSNCNTLWGAQYFLMDSAGFMGRKDGGQYEAVIDMLVKIRERDNTSRSFYNNNLLNA
jgi:hypothetical protein